MKPFKLDIEPKVTSGFTVPDDYFADFADQVVSKTIKEEPQVISIFKKKSFIVSAAASVAILIMVSIYSNYSTTSTDFDRMTLETYLTYQSSLNQFDLVNQLDAEDLNSLGANLDLEQEALEDILASSPSVISIISE